MRDRLGITCPLIPICKGPARIPPRKNVPDDVVVDVHKTRGDDPTGVDGHCVGNLRLLLRNGNDFSMIDGDVAVFHDTVRQNDRASQNYRGRFTADIVKS